MRLIDWASRWLSPASSSPSCPFCRPTGRIDGFLRKKYRLKRHSADLVVVVLFNTDCGAWPGTALLVMVFGVSCGREKIINCGARVGRPHLVFLCLRCGSVAREDPDKSSLTRV